MNEKTFKTLEIIGAVVVFLCTVAGVAYGIYRLLENKKLKKLDLTVSCGDFDDEDECFDREAVAELDELDELSETIEK